MCYSKEVQFTTGSIILLLSAYYYFLYYRKFVELSDKWLLPFLKNVVLGFAMIGLHQIFEWLALLSSNEIIYKLGLVVSISSMYFFIKSLEVMQNRNLKSYLALYIIAAVSIHIFLVDMHFAARSFYVQHQSAFFWAAAWMFLMIYFHVCAIGGYKLFKKEISKKALTFYLLATIDLSFVLSAIYVLWGYAKFNVNVCTDSPSIWCTFYVVQALVLPVFLAKVPGLIEAPKEKTVQNLKNTILYLVFSLLILSVLIATLPFFDCLSTKFVFP